MSFMPRNDRLVEISNLLRRRTDVYRAGGEGAEKLADLEREAVRAIRELAALLGADPRDVAEAVSKASGDYPPPAPLVERLDVRYAAREATTGGE